MFLVQVLRSRGGHNVERVAVIARLTEASAQRATELVGAGPPFDPADAKPVMAPAGDGSESWA
jgi:hypothetical protein